MKIKNLLPRGCSNAETKAGIQEALTRWIDDTKGRLPWFPRLEPRSTYVPLVDVVESEERVLVTAEIPGTNLQDVEVSSARGTLTIEGRKPEPDGHDEDEFRTCRRERRYGAFRRTIRLPASTVGYARVVTHEDGVLIVSLLKGDAQMKDDAEFAVAARERAVARPTATG